MESKSESRPSTPASNDQQHEQAHEEHTPDPSPRQFSSGKDAAPRENAEGVDWPSLINVAVRVVGSLLSFTGDASVSVRHGGNFNGPQPGFGGKWHPPVRLLLH
jgi:hypothetical protein